MRWRLYIFLLSATAAFCFMLLTAVTDYGTDGHYQPPLVSAARSGAAGLASLISPPAAKPVAEIQDRHSLAKQKFDPLLRPNSPRLFVAHNADPVTARQDAERAARLNRGGPAARNKLKLDEHGWHREEFALVTAYCPCPKCCGTHSPGITSIGKNAWTPGLAADPIYLEYGTQVFIPGYGLSVIDDTGGAMRRHWRRDGQLHIDVRMTYHYEARQWGKQYLMVKIYDEE